MRCLCCGTELMPEEKNQGWHKKCIKKFFGTKKLPEINISDNNLETLANEMTEKKLTVAGVQKKLSLHLSKVDGGRLTIVNYPTGYILKPQTEEYKHLPELEHLAMSLADAAGIRTVPHALIFTGEAYSYITKRIDRIISDDSVRKYAMEDFCQLSGRLTIDKYKGSYEACSRILDRYSTRTGFDKTEFFMRLFFSFLIGNSDMHLKNFSLIEEEPAKRQFHLSDAYDLLPVQLVLPEDTEQMALTLNGKKKNIRKKDFLSLAAHTGIPEKAAENMMKKMCNTFEKWEEICDHAILPEETKEKMKELIKNRMKIILPGS